jgi:RNA-directed DNA polymerase
VKTPALHVPGISCIEDFFDAKMLNAKLGDKTFNPKDDHDSSKEYGKAAFAEHVIRANAATIDFSRFTSILNRIVAVIDDYKPPAV